MTEPEGAYTVRFAPGAKRALVDGLPEAVAAAAFGFIHDAVAVVPYRVGKRLTGTLAHLHSARRGTYRILYSIDEDARTVNVLRIDHRSDVYRRF